MNEQHHHVRLNRSSLADGIDAFVRLALQVEVGSGYPQDVGQVGHHFLLAPAQFGALANHRHVHVSNSPAGSVHAAHGLFKKYSAGAAIILGSGIWKQLPNIRSTNRAQNGVGDRVHQHVAIRMRYRPAIMFETHATKYELSTAAMRRAWFEPV